MQLVDPTVVVALGTTALQALSGKRQAVKPLRGTLRTWEGGCLLVTVHPSFLLRLPDARARTIERKNFIEDLRRAATVTPVHKP